MSYINEDWEIKLPVQDFYKELMSQHLALSLPGHGNFCHREIECFGLNVPVLMYNPINKYHDPLVPNYHFIQIPGTYIDNDEHGEWLAQYLNDNLERINNDADLLNYVTANAKEWYIRNVSYPQSMILTHKLIVG